MANTCRRKAVSAGLHPSGEEMPRDEEAEEQKRWSSKHDIGYAGLDKSEDDRRK